MVKLHNDEKVKRRTNLGLEKGGHCFGDLALSSGVLSFMGTVEALVSQISVPMIKRWKVRD